MAKGFKHGDGATPNKLPEFTYTGDYEFIDDGDKNWRIKLFTSGTFVFTSIGNASNGIDVFCVGGGGGGAGHMSGGGTYGKGGEGGGGNGRIANNRGYDGTVNTGGGGGGGIYGDSGCGGAGGSGIVIIRNTRGVA